MAITEINKDNFAELVTNSDKPVLVDFFATWCGPCKMLGPVLEQIATENDSFTIYKVNVDEQPELAAKFDVMTIPTLISFKGGEVAGTTVGVKPKQEIIAMMG